jgi:hypothetical protein
MKSQPFSYQFVSLFTGLAHLRTYLEVHSAGPLAAQCSQALERLRADVNL